MYKQGEMIEVLSHDWMEAEFLCMEADTAWVKDNWGLSPMRIANEGSNPVRHARAFDTHRPISKDVTVTIPHEFIETITSYVEPRGPWAPEIPKDAFRRLLRELLAIIELAQDG
jgi:hypothetical protein